jgi:stage III sporulation protein AF
MFEYLYEWIQNIVFFLVISTAVMQVLPGKTYQKYVQLFTGMILILLMMTPALRLIGAQGLFESLYQSKQYEMETEEIEKQRAYLEGLDVLDFLPDAYLVPSDEDEGEEQAGVTIDRIEIEEVVIGNGVETESGIYD